MRSWYEILPDNTSKWRAATTIQSIWAKYYTVSLQRKPNDSQNMQHAQQPGSDAEAVVQYLGEWLVTRKVCADTGGMHLLRALVIIENTIFFSCVLNGCEGRPATGCLKRHF